MCQSQTLCMSNFIGLEIIILTDEWWTPGADPGFSNGGGGGGAQKIMQLCTVLITSEKSLVAGVQGRPDGRTWNPRLGRV